jgi:hypothetical protein
LNMMSSEQYFSYIILMKGNSGKFWCFVMTTSVAKIVSIYLTTFKIWVNKSNICHMQCDSTPNLNCPFGIVSDITDLDIIKRLMIIGTCLLIDFNNFEHDRRFCCWHNNFEHDRRFCCWHNNFEHDRRFCC